MNQPLKIENRHTGEILRMRRVREANGQVILMIEGTLPPHTGGPPLHVHFQEHEQGHVAAGILGAIVGNTKITAQTGEPVHLPAGDFSSVVECRRRAAGIQWPGRSGR